MQIGNSELDALYRDIYVPVLSACGLQAARIDKHNRGELLKSEIIRLIRESDLILADLTNERPNAYLEIGYAMGIEKFGRLVLTVREDHFLDSPNHRADGPKVHFDLSGYDITRWHKARLGEFQDVLQRKIRQRLTNELTLPSAAGSPSALVDKDVLQVLFAMASGRGTWEGLAMAFLHSMSGDEFAIGGRRVALPSNELTARMADSLEQLAFHDYATVGGNERDQYRLTRRGFDRARSLTFDEASLWWSEWSKPM